MQRAYFLGGASPSGFETAFWNEQKHCYGCYLKGGPGTGKSTLMKKLAAAFAGEEISVYHCASDPHSLDAVVFEERGIFVADATAPHESSTPLPFVTGELVDLAEGLSAEQLADTCEAVLTLHAENQAAHMQARKGLAGLAAMEDMIADIGTAALYTEKLSGYAGRFCKRLLSRRSGSSGILLHRQSRALTPQGDITLCPAEFDVIALHDTHYAASAILLAALADQAVQNGLRCEVTHSLTRRNRPITHVILPEQRLAVIAAAHLPESALPNPVTVMHMQRFYDPAVLRKQRTLTKFCAKTAAAMEEKTIELLAEALRIHDALETYYIGALNPAFLDRKTAELVTKILAHPRRA